MNYPVAVMPKKPKRNDIAVKVGLDVIQQARVVCAHRNIPLAEYLTESLRQPVKRDYENVGKEIAKSRHD